VKDEVVGREQELARIDEFLDGVPAGAATLLIEGEPGIGKTTVWLSAVERARERAYRVLAAHPVEAETKLSFAALGDLLDDVVDEALAGLPSPQRRALEVALLVEEAEGPPPDQRAVAAAFLNVVRRLAADRPLVLAVDDVQWLDATSGAVLAFAIRRLRHEAVGAILAWRTAPRESIPLGLDGPFAENRLERLPTGPLSLGALHHVLNARIGIALPRPLMRRVYEVSGGNPFFALELARALQRHEDEIEPGEALPVPVSLRTLVTDRLSALPRETQDALVVAAALSQPTVELVGAAIGGDADAALAPAVEAGVIDVAEGRIRFAHPLLASGAYSRVDAARRRTVHGSVASLVGDAEERARHLALATAEPDAGVASALEGAARTAFLRGAPHAAVDLCEHALRLTPAEEADSLRRRRIVEAQYCLHAGESARARSLLEAVLAASPPGPLRAEAFVHLGWIEFFGLDWQGSAEFHAAALREPDVSDRVRARSELGISRALLLLRKDMHAVAAHAGTAVTLGERLDDSHLLAEALAIQGEAEFIMGHSATGFQLIERALSIEPTMRSLAIAQSPRSISALTLSWADKIEESLAEYEELRQSAVEHGDETSLAWILARMGLVECLAGSWDDAARHLEDAFEIIVGAGQDANRAVILATKALVAAHRGDTSSARAAGEEALAVAKRRQAKLAERIARSALGFLDLSLARPADAHTHLEPLIEETRAASIREPSDFPFLADDIEALIALDRLGEAEESLAFLEECAERTGRVSALAAAGRCRGMLQAENGDLNGALASLERALRHHEEVSMPFERARTLLVSGSVQRRAKRKRDARVSIEGAVDVFERLRAALWVERARSELARISGRAPSPGALTPAEERVAALVAEGRTNREVAAALFVSERTVEFHLSRIYGKLGLRSRAELAHRFGAGDISPLHR
jgi:DNA-binding CsgD family transcriptional regulator